MAKTVDPITVPEISAASIRSEEDLNVRFVLRQFDQYVDFSWK